MAAEAATVLKLCVEDMDCGACALKIENELKRLPGVGDVNVKVGPERLSFAFDEDRTSRKAIEDRIRSLGYRRHYPPQRAARGCRCRRRPVRGNGS